MDVVNSFPSPKSLCDPGAAFPHLPPSWYVPGQGRSVQFSLPSTQVLGRGEDPGGSRSSSVWPGSLAATSSPFLLISLGSWAILSLSQLSCVPRTHSAFHQLAFWECHSWCVLLGS
jgi:hypothetical protein